MSRSDQRIFSHKYGCLQDEDKVVKAEEGQGRALTNIHQVQVHGGHHRHTRSIPEAVKDRRAGNESHRGLDCSQNSSVRNKAETEPHSVGDSDAVSIPHLHRAVYYNLESTSREDGAGEGEEGNSVHDFAGVSGSDAECRTVESSMVTA